MGLLNLLVQAQDWGISIYTEIYNVPLNWIGYIIKFLVGAVGVGVGIILFSLILKLITLPFDVYQRISMRKQNIKMKENQARMEKLQKQYANDKDTYNKKVMEMYKENGLSTFSSCLPMILSMVIFFVAIGAFNQYSAFESMESYNKMVKTYNKKMMESVSDLTEENISYTVLVTKSEETDGEGNVISTSYAPTGTVKFTVKDTTENGKYIYYEVNYGAKEEEIVETFEGSNVYEFRAGIENSEGVYEYKVENNKPFILNYIQNKEYKKVKGGQDSEKKLTYKVNADKLYNVDSSVCKKAEIDPIKDKIYQSKKWNDETEDKKQEIALTEAIKEYFVSPAQKAVAVDYESNIKKDTKFLWIKNIWVTDAAYKHPVMEYDEFKTLIAERSGCSCGKNDSPALKLDTYKKTAYNEITGQLNKQKGQPNGFFVLIALSIGTILLQQFVSMRSQKEQQKYSSVDGQNGGQQKMMMIMMTGMFAIFSFMYSSAFSIYLIVSNLFSMLSTLVINKIVDKVAEKKDEKAEKAKYERRISPKTATEKGKKLKSVKIKDEKTDKKNK